MKVTLKRYQVRDLFNAIKAMDGAPQVVNDKDGKFAGLVNKPYEFDDAKPTYALAKTREKIRAEVVAIDEAQQAILKALPDDAGAKARTEAESKIQALLTEDVEVDVHRLVIQSLNVHRNKIPPSVLCDLMPMLEGEL